MISYNDIVFILLSLVNKKEAVGFQICGLQYACFKVPTALGTRSFRSYRSLTAPLPYLRFSHQPYSRKFTDLRAHFSRKVFPQNTGPKFPFRRKHIS